MSVEPKTFLRKILFDGFRIAVESDYGTPEFMKMYLKEAKNLRGAWFKEQKLWVFSKSNGETFLKLLSDAFPDNFPKDFVQQTLDAALEFPDPGSLLPMLEVRLFPTDENTSVLTSRYDAVLTLIIHQVGGVWDSKNRIWVFEDSPENILKAMERTGRVRIEDILVYPHRISISKIIGGKLSLPNTKGFLGSCMSVTRDAKGVAQSLRFVPFMTPLKKNPVSEDLLERLKLKYQLMDHQVGAVRHILSSSSSLLADDMGLGKTRSSLVAAIASGGRTLVVCPPVLKTNWRREMMMLDQKESDIFTVHSSDIPVPPSAKWVIVSYQGMENLVFLNQKFDNMIVDEAHYIKELKSQRTKNAFLVAANIPKRILVTATPILNREAEIHTLLEFSGHPLGQMDRKDFLDLFAKSTEARSLLAERINEWVLRRTKEEAIQLPKRQILSPVMDPAPHFLDDYAKIVKDVSLLPLQKESRLRYLLEVVHAEYVLSELPEVLDEHKSVIFCERIEVLDLMMKRLAAMGVSAVRISGGEKDRDKSIDAFQDDPKVRVLVAAIKGASEGLNLTAGTYAWFCTIPYTPTQLDQAMARIYRIGQKRDVTVVVPIVHETIDMKTLAIIETKRKIIADIGL